MASSLPEFKRCLDKAFRHVVWFLVLSFAEPGIGLELDIEYIMILRGAVLHKIEN